MLFNVQIKKPHLEALQLQLWVLGDYVGRQFSVQMLVR